MPEEKTTLPGGGVQPSGDVDDLIFPPQADWQTSDR